MIILQKIKDWWDLRKSNNIIKKLDKQFTDTILSIASTQQHPIDAVRAILKIEKLLDEDSESKNEYTRNLGILFKKRYGQVLYELKKKKEWEVAARIQIKNNEITVT